VENKKKMIMKVIFISMLFIFSIYTISLAQQYPRKIRGIYFYLDQGNYELDHLNLSEVQSLLSENGYRINFTYDLPYGIIGDGLKIIPSNNPDFVAYLIQEVSSDVYFHGWVESKIRFPGGSGEIGKAEDIIIAEMELILGYLEQEQLKDDIRIGDNDFEIMFETFNAIVFSFFLSVILIISFILLYKKGLLIDGLLEFRIADPKVKGVLLLFLGLFPFLYFSNELINGIIIDSIRVTFCSGICLVISIVIIITGIYAIYPIKKEIS
jgi:hypothetical protein